jgi:hypothetical protein
MVYKPLRQLALYGDIIKVRNVVQGLNLLSYRCNHGRVGVSQSAGSNTGHKIEIFAALGIPNATAEAPF